MLQYSLTCPPPCTAHCLARPWHLTDTQHSASTLSAQIHLLPRYITRKVLRHEFISTLYHLLFHTAIMSSDQVEPTSSTSALVASSSSTGDSNGNSNGNGNGASKPRARLGPIETVTLPPDDSDSEPDDDAEPDAEGGEAAGEDFLKDYPDDTEVHHITSCDKASENQG